VGKRMVDLHNQLEGHIKGLQELDKLKSDFLSMVSHELRTPLAVMKGGVTLCLDEIPGKLNETQKDLLQDTLDNINQLTRLITDLLDMSKIEAGKVTLHKDFFDLSALVQKIHKTFSSEAEKKSITLNLDYQEREAPVYADRDKVIQIFYNLVSNAMRYTKAGGSVTLTVREEKKEYICSVVDTGVGISRENMEKLFSKFEQFGRVDGPGYKGTGLGLTIAKGLVEKHGGRIWAKSKLGTGTTFFFTLKKMDNPSILAVGDERQVVKQVENSLNHKGFNFIEAYNGEEAFLKPRSDRPA